MSDPYSLCVVLKVKPDHAEAFAKLVGRERRRDPQRQGYRRLQLPLGDR
jgi:hypothetical protein